MPKCKQPNGPLQFPDDSAIGSDKVQLGDSTTGTSTSTTYKSSPPPTEYGWVCPRCSRVNAPWKSQCDCSGNNWYPTWNYKEPWQYEVTCQGTDSNKATTTWSAINSNMTNPSCTSVDSPWNQFYTLTNQLDKVQKEINNLKENK